ncbi:MAG TPA: hypothetical protein VKB38_01990 [Terracidiphilus sp.]|nr:hypothetical protein [Terracidiphilus sp.]
MKPSSWSIAVAVLLVEAAQAQSLVIGQFARPAEANPVIAPQKQSTFVDPILRAPVQWEALHTFNPAATASRSGK